MLGGVTSTSLALEPSLDLEQWRGRVVVVDFWASWCEPCRRSFPWLNEMQAKYRDQGLVVIGVNVDAERSEADRFLAAVPAAFKVVYDPTGTLPARYGVSAMPSSFVFDRSGELSARHLGFQARRRGEYEAVIKQLLKSAAPGPGPGSTPASSINASGTTP